MCLILLANQYSEKYKLILVSNRDEYHDREALAANFWPENPLIFGGVDNRANGSWLAIDTTGRIAAVTNVRLGFEESPRPQSRGLLVKQFLEQAIPAAAFIDNLKQQNEEYAPFNIVLFDNTGLWHYSSITNQTTPIQHGVHGVSNATLNTPWPKVTLGIQTLQEALAADSLTRKQIIHSVCSQRQANDADLPDTGIDFDAEKFLSSQFIIGEDYGTRCTTLITVDTNDLLRFDELTFDANGAIQGTVEQSFQLTA